MTKKRPKTENKDGKEKSVRGSSFNGFDSEEEYCSVIETAFETWLNSDKELITYQLLADGFRGAYGQIPSDFQKEVRRDSLYPPSKYNFIEIG